jgi:hypothetical protein
MNRRSSLESASQVRVQIALHSAGIQLTGSLVSREKGFGEAALLDQYLHKLDSSSSLGNNWAILYLLDQLKGGFKDGPAPAPAVPSSLFSVPLAQLSGVLLLLSC